MIWDTPGLIPTIIVVGTGIVCIIVTILYGWWKYGLPNKEKRN